MHKAKVSIIFSLILAGLACKSNGTSTLVQWGNSGGDTNIVSASVKLEDSAWTSYVANRVVLESSETYYPSNSERSPAFNNASSNGYGTRNIADSSDGDSIQYGKNDSYNAMVVWEELLVEGAELSALNIELKSFGTVDAASFRWLIQNADGTWFASDASDVTDSYQSFSVTDPADLTWNEFTPRDTVGTATNITFEGIASIGYFFDTTYSASTQSGVQVRYFQAEGIAASEPPKPLTSLETGYTIQKIRTAANGTDTLIIGSSYEGSMLGFSYDGTALWTNVLSGYMVHDIWCEDLTGEGDDEILVANADGHIYCLDSTTGTNRWQFVPNDGGHLTPMYAVCTVHSNGTPYVVCGAYDKYIHYVDADGNLEKSVYSQTYSIANTWGDDAPPDNLHNANFLRPIPQADGTEKLAVLGSMSHMQDNGVFYLFDPLADEPYLTKDVSGPKVVGDMTVIDPDGDKKYEIILGGSVLNGDSIVRFDPTSETMNEWELTGSKGSAGYRVTQVATVPDGDSFLYFILCGATLELGTPSFDTNVVSSAVNYQCSYAFNDLWQDPDSGDILLASAQSGGSCIHIIDPDYSDWKTDFENLAPPGKIATIIENTDNVWTNLATFSKPTWERDPVDVVLTAASPTHPVALDIQANYDSPKFLNYYWDSYAQDPEDWGRDTELADNPTYRDKRDTRRSYTLTQSEILTKVGNEDDGGTGLAMWGGHGNDPYYYSLDTLKGIIDLQNGNKTVLIWPEMNGSSDAFEMVMTNRFYPLAEYASEHNANIYVRNKNVFWQGAVYLSAWKKVRNGDYSDVFVSGLEETTDKTQDLSVVGRMGIWASGGMDNWGMRCSRDNPSFDRQRQHSYQRLPNHFLRNMVYNLAAGASYLNVTYVDTDYQSLAWQLVAQGALFVPKRNEIVSFNPVHLGMTDPDEDYLDDAENCKWTTFYDQAFEQANPFVFSHMNGSWPAAPVTTWDFSRYAAGVKDRRQNFIPPYPNGMVLITSPQDGAFADETAYRSPMKNYLHPLYSDILQEFITDGRHYYSSDGTTTYAADSYYTTVADAITDSAVKLPLTVAGDVAWVCAQTADNHLRLTLVDSGYLNPKARTASVTFHTVTPLTITDILTGETITTSGTSTEITVPLGLFRFIDIELSEDFYAETQSSWKDYKYLYGLSGETDADYDEDGEEDIYEYALGGDPKDSEIQATLPWIQINDDLTASYFHNERDDTNPGVSYVAEWTDELIEGSWSNTWSSLNYDTTDDSDFLETEHLLDTSNRTNLFFRLRITQP